jgi:hypothetical protein
VEVIFMVQIIYTVIRAKKILMVAANLSIATAIKLPVGFWALN